MLYTYVIKTHVLNVWLKQLVKFGVLYVKSEDENSSDDHDHSEKGEKLFGGIWYFPISLQKERELLPVPQKSENIWEDFFGKFYTSFEQPKILQWNT